MSETRRSVRYEDDDNEALAEDIEAATVVSGGSCHSSAGSREQLREPLNLQQKTGDAGDLALGSDSVIDMGSAGIDPVLPLSLPRHTLSDGEEDEEDVAEFKRFHDENGLMKEPDERSANDSDADSYVEDDDSDAVGELGEPQRDPRAKRIARFLGPRLIITIVLLICILTPGVLIFFIAPDITISGASVLTWSIWLSYAIAMYWAGLLAARLVLNIVRHVLRGRESISYYLANLSSNVGWVITSILILVGYGALMAGNLGSTTYTRCSEYQPQPVNCTTVRTRMDFANVPLLLELQIIWVVCSVAFLLKTLLLRHMGKSFFFLTFAKQLHNSLWNVRACKTLRNRAVAGTKGRTGTRDFLMRSVLKMKSNKSNSSFGVNPKQENSRVTLQIPNSATQNTFAPSGVTPSSPNPTVTKSPFASPSLTRQSTTLSESDAAANNGVKRQHSRSIQSALSVAKVAGKGWSTAFSDQDDLAEFLFKSSRKRVQNLDDPARLARQTQAWCDDGRTLFELVNEDSGRLTVARTTIASLLDNKQHCYRLLSAMGLLHKKRLTMEDFENGYCKIQLDNYNLQLAVRESSSILSALDTAITSLLIAFLLLVSLWILQLDVNQIWTTVAGLLIAFAFVFGDALRNFFEACIFIFVDRVYAIGDRVVIDDDMEKHMLVKHISIRHTTFLTWDGRWIYYPNSDIAGKPVINLNRCPPQSENIRLVLADGMDQTKIDQLCELVREYIAQRPEKWKSIRIDIEHEDGEEGFVLALRPMHINNWQDMAARVENQNEFMLYVRKTMKKLEIDYNADPTKVILKVERDSVSLV